MKKTIIAIVAVVIAAALAIGGYFIFSDKGESGQTEIELTVVKDDFTLNDTLLGSLIKNPDRYQARLANEYGMGETLAAKFYEAPEEWLAYEQIIEITNNSADSITVYGFEVENNGENGVFVNTNLGGELGVSPGGKGPASFSVLFSDGELSTEEAKALLDKMEIKVIYTKTPAEYDDGSVSVEATKTAIIENSEVI